MKTVLEINNLNYTYHTPEGETPALRSFRLREIYTSFSHIRTSRS